MTAVKVPSSVAPTLPAPAPLPPAMPTPTLAELTKEFRLITIGEIVESPWNPRKHFDPKTLAELAASLKDEGQLTPIIVRPMVRKGSQWGNEATPYYEIAAGHRRYRAAKIAGLSAVLVRIRDMDDKAFIRVLTIENLQRDNLTALEEAESFQLMLKRGGFATVAAIEAEVKKSASYIYQRLKLLELTPTAKTMLQDEEITPKHAILIARLQTKDQDRAIKFLQDESFWDGNRRVRTTRGVRELESWVQREIHLDLATAPWSLTDAILIPKAGACAACPKRAGAQPELFADIAKGDTCTDPACFNAKLSRALDTKRAELKKAKQPYMEILDESWSRGSNPGRGTWVPAARGSCKSAQAGLVIEGPRRGQVLHVCADSRCRKHHSGNVFGGGSSRSSHSLTAADKAAQKRQRTEAEKKKAREAQLPAVLTALKAEFLRGVQRRHKQLADLPNDVVLAIAGSECAFYPSGPRSSRRTTVHDEKIETSLAGTLPGKWRKEYWGDQAPANAVAARQFIALRLYVGLDTRGLDKRIDSEITAAVKAAKLPPADPKTVSCPNCKAKAGSPCKRPSGHPVFGGAFHSQREKAAQQQPKQAKGSR